MDQWLSGLLSAFARDLVCGAVDQLRYPCCFNGFVDDLQGAKDKLITTKDSVNDRVEHGKKQAMKNAQVIHAWLEQEANPLKGNVEDLLEKARINKSCCFGHCPNWIWRYRLAKKLAKKKVQVENCIEEGREYIRYERVASLPGTQHLPWEKSLEFDSRQGAYEQLIRALKDDDVTVFGLYGMGGCGKTTMAMELMRTAEAEHLFVPMSTSVEVRKIQKKIASALQFKFPEAENGERERAQRLCERLTLEKRTLVILDDVWRYLDFGEIGIPLGENHKNCKVMITTRSVAVCTSMDCQPMINLETLTDEEAWELFQKKAHISENTPNTLKNLGRQISNECKGLPVTIAALAGTLKGKAEVYWKVALDRLRSSIPVNIEKGLQNPYKCLEVSYDNLDANEEAKSLLLLCSVFPEDTEIPVEFLPVFAIGLGLVREAGSFEGARNEVSAAKNELISSSLLLSSFDDDTKEECVKMHDLIRDVVHWIASKENKAIKCVLEKATTLECSSIRYLWCTELPNELECSCIEFLRLDTEFEISGEIFKGMERLRVLILSRESEDGSLSTMSLKSLTNLRCLFLSGWELGDISSIGYVKKLESLVLVKCSFFELPDTLITELTNLRLLHLSECRMKRNPFEVIGRHLQLEELYYYEGVTFKRYESDSEDGDHAEFFKMSSVPQALQRYRIKFGSRFEDFNISRLNCHRALIISCFDTSNAVEMELAKKSEVLLAANILGGAKNVIPDIYQKAGGGTMNCGWIELWLRYSEEIECLVDNSNHSQEVGTPFLELRKLRIECMECLGALYHGVPPSGLFEKLEQLYIRECPMLTCLLTPAAACSLVQLQKLKIYECGGLKHILEDDDSEISRHDDKLVFSKLKLLRIKNCSMLEYAIPVTFVQGLVQLESLKIHFCGKLEYVFGQGTHGGDKSQNELKIEIPALEGLELTDNANMMSIFPKYCSASCPSLRWFNLVCCPEFDILSIDTFKPSNWKLQDVRANGKHFHTLETLVVTNNFKVESIFRLESIGGVSLGLKRMELWNLDEMKYVCAGFKNSFAFQNLKRLDIQECKKLEVIFPASVLKCLPELKYLEIGECQELKQIIEEDSENKKSSNLVSPQPCFPKLAKLVIRNCNNLKCLFYTSVSACNDLPNLEVFSIEGASELQELIGYGQGLGDDMEKVKVELPKLKFLMLISLSNLCQGIELPTATLRLVHDCPKLSLISSSAVLEEFKGKLSELEADLERNGLYAWHIVRFVESHHVFVPEDTRVENPNEEGTTCFPIGPDDEHASSSEVHSTLSGVMGTVDTQSMSAPSLMNKQMPPAETTATIEIPLSIKREGASSHNAEIVSSSTHKESDNLQQGPLVTSQHKSYPHNIEGTETTTNGEIPTSPKPILPTSGSELATPLHIIHSSSIEDQIKESVQEGYTSKDNMEATMSGDIGGDGLGVVVVHLTETKLHRARRCRMMMTVSKKSLTRWIKKVK